MSFSLGEYQDIFLEEADEQLQELNQNLIKLEKNPDDIDIINNIFRAAHSLKSSAAFVGLNDLSDLAHKMENLLQGIRDKTMEVSSDIVDLIFKCFDAINLVIESVAAGNAPTTDLSGLIDEIQQMGNRDKKSTKSKDDTEDHVKEDDIPKTAINGSDLKKIKQHYVSGGTCKEITIFIDNTAQMKWVKAQLVLASLEKIGEILRTIPDSNQFNNDDMSNIFKVLLLSNESDSEIFKTCEIDLIIRIDLRKVDITSNSDGKPVVKFGKKQSKSFETVSEAEGINERADETVSAESDTYETGDEHDEIGETAETAEEKEQEHERRKTPGLKTVKVSVDKLDLLLNNVAELVIANSGFYKLYEEIRKSDENKPIISEFKSRMELMARIAKDLQSGIMKTRMVPIGNVFHRFTRLVRDLSKEFDKKVELVIKGEETELDKKVIDSIGEPLMHLIRNAVDHGVEETESRKTSGKSEVSYVTLNAYQGGNQIFVEVSDDGKGLDVEAIKRNVQEKGLATMEMLSTMEEQDIYNYIFAPGFSTAKVITDVSGRGVGMNVVKEIVNELNGNVSIETEPGMGTRFVMAFPLTLAIIPAIMVKVKHEMYAIPLSDVIETIKIAKPDIQTIEGHEVINLRGEILSLLRLSSFVGLRTKLPPKKIPVVVVGFGNRKIGLIVDQLEGKLEIVIKSLEQNYKTVEGLAGASILGDGSICLILDVASMINKVLTEQDRLSNYDFDQMLEDEAEIEEVESEVDHEINKKTNELIQKAQERIESSESEKKSLDEDAVISAGLEPKEVFTSKPVEKSETEETEIEETKEEKELSTVAPPLKKDAGAFKTEVGEKDEREESVDIETKGDDTEKEIKDDDSVFFSNEVITVTQDHSMSELVYEEELGKDHIKDSSIFADQTTPVADSIAQNSEVDSKVHEALEEFKNELRNNIDATIGQGDTNEHMEASLDISKDYISQFRIVANVGAANAAESLSKILDKRIDLSIPEVKLHPTEKIPELIGSIEDIYIGVMLPLLGDTKGTLLFALKAKSGFKLIDMLYGTSSKEKNELDEDGESALKEVTNIIGSSVINVFAEKTGLVLKPSIPTIVHDYMQSVIDSILVMQAIENDYAIVMDTAFYFEDDSVIGNLLLLPEAKSLKTMIEHLRVNE